jgi:DNA-binding NarL/FixJ family response regulator
MAAGARREALPEQPPAQHVVRVLIVDDHQLFADGLEHLLGLEPEFEVVATANSIEHAIHAAQECRPDIALVDYLLPDGDGAGAVRALRAVVPTAKFVVVTALNDDATFVAALDSGCDAFVTKDRAADELVGAMRAVSRGESVFPPDLLVRTLPSMRLGRATRDAMTRRELQVLALLAEGASTAEIAERLCISTNTVRNHVQNLLGKLGARSRLEAVAIAGRRGLVSGAPDPL